MNEPPMNPSARPAPNNFLVPAILATLFCCLPTGIVGIIYANEVNTKLLGGDYAGALAASSKAKMWTYISVGLAVGASLIWCLFLGGLGLLGSAVETAP